MQIYRHISRILVIAGLLALNGCQAHEPVGYVSVGSASDILATLAAKMTIYALQREGYQVEDRTGYPSTLEARKALLNQEIDMGWFDTAEVWHKVMGHDQPIAEPEELARAVREEDKNSPVTWLNPAPLVLRPGLVLLADSANSKWSQVSQLAASHGRYDPLRLCIDEHITGSSSSLVAFQVGYALNIPPERLVPYQARNVAQALKTNQCNCALSYQVFTEGDDELIFLQDDKHILQATGYALAVRQELFSNYPHIQYILERVSSWLSPANVMPLVGKLDAGEPVEEIVRKFVDSQSK